MEVDLEKALISKFELIRRIRKIEYEGIHLGGVCFFYLILNITFFELNIE